MKEKIIKELVAMYFKSAINRMEDTMQRKKHWFNALHKSGKKTAWNYS